MFYTDCSCIGYYLSDLARLRLHLHGQHHLYDALLQLAVVYLRNDGAGEQVVQDRLPVTSARPDGGHGAAKATFSD